MADVIDKALAIKALRDLADSLETSGSNVYITAVVHDTFRPINTERLTVEWKR